MSKKNRQRPENIHTCEDGNTVRKLEAAPDDYGDRKQRQEERRLSEQKRRRRRAARRNRERALKMNAGYVVFLSVCVIVVTFTMAVYVKMQSDLVTRRGRIETLESEVSQLKTDNDSAYKRINASINLKKVKRQARKFGMKYPKDTQIIYYTIDNSDFMTQYSD